MIHNWFINNVKIFSLKLMSIKRLNKKSNGIEMESNRELDLVFCLIFNYKQNNSLIYLHSIELIINNELNSTKTLKGFVLSEEI